MDGCMFIYALKIRGKHKMRGVDIKEKEEEPEWMFCVLLWYVYMKTASESAFPRKPSAIDVAVAFQALMHQKKTGSNHRM